MSGERLQDHWSSSFFLIELFFSADRSLPLINKCAADGLHLLTYI